MVTSLEKCAEEQVLADVRAAAKTVVLVDQCARALWVGSKCRKCQTAVGKSKGKCIDLGQLLVAALKRPLTMKEYVRVDYVLASYCEEHRAALFRVQSYVVYEIRLDGAEARLIAVAAVNPLRRA
jgi:hypothetical protein